MEQVRRNTTSGDSKKLYRSPEARVDLVKAQGVLCGSNDPIREYDYGTGGFNEA